jgi:hypothetical protein
MNCVARKQSETAEAEIVTWRRPLRNNVDSCEIDASLRGREAESNERYAALGVLPGDNRYNLNNLLGCDALTPL